MSDTTTTTTDAPPAINLGNLTAADMRAVIRLSGATGVERAEILLNLLEKAVDGGLETIPLQRLPDYLTALDAELEGAMSPKR